MSKDYNQKIDHYFFLNVDNSLNFNVELSPYLLWKQQTTKQSQEDC